MRNKGSIFLSFFLSFLAMCAHDSLDYLLSIIITSLIRNVESFKVPSSSFDNGGPVLLETETCKI